MKVYNVYSQAVYMTWCILVICLILAGEQTSCSQARKQNRVHLPKRKLQTRSLSSQSALLHQAAILDAKMNALAKQGKGQAAIVAARSALLTREKALPLDAIEIAHSLTRLASLEKQQNYIAAALNHFQRAVSILNQKDKEKGDIAIAYGFIAECNLIQYNLAAAMPAYNRAIKTFDQRFSDRPDLQVMYIQMFAGQLLDRGYYQEAERLYHEVSERYARQAPKDATDTAENLLLYARSLRRQHKYEEAQAKINSALAIWQADKVNGAYKAIFGRLEMIAVLYDKGEQAQAHTLFEQLDQLIEKATGSTPEKVVDLLDVLAQRQEKEQNYIVCRWLYERILTLVEQLKGPEAGELAIVYVYMARMYKQEGNYVEAVKSYRQCLERLEPFLKSRQPDYETAYEQTALEVVSLGDISTARKYLETALAFYEGQPDENAMWEAANYNFKLGGLFVVQMDYAQARPRLEKAIKVYQQAPLDFAKSLVECYKLMGIVLSHLGDNHARQSWAEKSLWLRQHIRDDTTPNYLVDQADLLQTAGKPREALSLLQKAVSRAEAEYGPESGSLSTYLDDLASVLETLGSRAKARPLRMRSLRIREKLLGRNHLNVSASYYDLAVDDWDDNKIENAAQNFLTTGRIFQTNIANNFAFLSFAEQRYYITTLVSSALNGLLSTCRTDTKLIEAYDLFYAWKGLLVESLYQQTQINRLGANPALKPQIDRLQSTRGRLAAWYNNAGNVPYAEWEAQNRILTQEKERLERELAMLVPNVFLEDPLRRAPGLNGLRRLLKSDEAFIDIYLYRPLKSNQISDAKQRQNSYAAVVILPGADLRLVNLGDKQSVQQVITTWQNEVLKENTGEAEWKELAATLWKPLAAVLPTGIHKLWISLEADAALVPWNLLPESVPQTRGMLVAVVSSARELTRLRQSRQATLADKTQTLTSPRLLIAGDIDYDAGRMSGDMIIAEGQPGWNKPLHTGDELDQIVKVAEQNRLTTIPLIQAQVTKDALRSRIENATYVHLATHGFFERSHLTLPSTQDDKGSKEIVGGRNPLVESGIAIAGANVRDTSGFSSLGLLTAEELVGLDLSRCSLITLSSCDSALGTQISGQGVMGLRSAILGAGARSMLMALWEVPDDATTRIMTLFYTNLWNANLSKAEALARAQKQMQADPNFAAPINWAGWVLAGEVW